MPNLTITVLVDNAESCNLASEWGLSVHLQDANTSVLLDFGQTDAFVRNAEALNIDLATVDHAVLSHAHYDHANGMRAFFALNDHAPLHLSEACAEDCWSTKGGTTEAHYIGMEEGLVERYAARLERHATECVSSIAPNFYVVPHTAASARERAGATEGMYRRIDGSFVPDTFAHELTLVYVRPNGDLVILSSCSHAGVAAILREVASAFPHHHMHAFIGGLHLMHAADEDILNVAQVFKTYEVKTVWCGHCTGEHAASVLMQELPQRLNTLQPGLRIVL